MKTLQEFKGELTEKEEVELIDLLEITSYDIVDRFDDRVEKHCIVTGKRFPSHDTKV